jgi:tetratricopeptide (TPR) repeat protein
MIVGGKGRRVARPALVAGGLVVGLLVAVVVAGLGGRWNRTAREPWPPVDRPSGPAPEDLGAARFLAGLERAREGRWAEARSEFAAAALAGVPEAPGQLERVERKLAAVGAAARARELLAAGDLVGATRAWREAEGENPGLGSLPGDLREAVRRRREELARELAGSGDGGAARTEWEALAALWPDETLPPPTPPGTGRGEREARTRSPVDRAFAAFRAGRIAEARAAVAGCPADRCRSVDGALATVEAALAGDDRTALEAGAAAIRFLGGSPSLEAALGAKLAPQYHARGEEALRRGDLAVARASFDKALAVRPDYGPSRVERDRLRERAKEEFLAAYAEKDATPDRARQKFELVTTITAPEEELHRKAQTWLERLEAGARASR